MGINKEVGGWGYSGDIVVERERKAGYSVSKTDGKLKASSFVENLEAISLCEGYAFPSTQK